MKGYKTEQEDICRHPAARPHHPGRVSGVPKTIKTMYHRS